MDFTYSSQLNKAPSLGTGPQVNSYGSVAGTYVASSEGTLDFGSGAATGAALSVPFGSVGVARHVEVNNVGQSGSFRISQNGGTAFAFELPAGAKSVLVSIPAGPSVGAPVTSLTVAVGALQPGLGQLQYVILGD